MHKTSASAADLPITTLMSAAASLAPPATRAVAVIGRFASRDLASVLAVGLLVLGTAFPVGGSLVFLSDVVAAFGLLATVLNQPRELLKRTLASTENAKLCFAAVVGLVLASVLSLVVHPSANGVLVTARYIAIVGLVPMFVRSLRSRPTFVGVFLGAIAMAESAVVIAQSYLGHRVGLGSLEPPLPFISVAPGADVPTGTLHQPDLHGWFIAAVAVVVTVLALRKLVSPWFGAAVLAFGAAANMVSFRRSFVVVWFVIASILLIRTLASGRGRRVTSAVLLVGILAGSALTFPHAKNGWLSRAEVNAGDQTTGRTALLPQMARVLATSPAFGVGPGGYMGVLIRVEPTLEKPTMVHVTPLLLVAEGGWTMAAALTLAATATCLAIVRRRRALRFDNITDVALAALPFAVVCLLTPLPTLYAVGPLLAAFHLAMIRVFAPVTSRVDGIDDLDDLDGVDNLDNAGADAVNPERAAGRATPSSGR